MDVMGMAVSSTAHSLQSVQSAVKMSMLSKVMSQDPQSMRAVLEGLHSPDQQPNAAELSVNPHVGSRVDIRI